MLSVSNIQDAHFGTEKDGTKSEDYCTYCYKDGEFVGGDSTMEEVVEFSIKPCLDEGLYPDEETARAELIKIFSGLKRWAK